MKSTVESFLPKGKLVAPASKSDAIRALFAAFLTQKSWTLHGWGWSDDVYHGLHAITTLGAQVHVGRDSVKIEAGSSPVSTTIYAGESGLCARLLSVLLLRYPFQMTLKGGGSLARRPMTAVEELYDQLEVIYRLESGRLPLSMFGGVSPEADLTMDGSLTSQFFTGALYLLSDIDFAHELKIDNPTSQPYIDMTLSTLGHFGARWLQREPNVYQLDGVEWQSGAYTIEGDWSACSIWIAIGAIAGDIEIAGLDRDSLQADKAILGVPGLQYEWHGDVLNIAEQEIQGFEFDATDCPDLFPALVLMACGSKGASVLKGVERLTHKESARAQALQEIVCTLGGQVRIEGNNMIVEPTPLHGAKVSGYADHRMVMVAAALACMSSGPIEIEGIEAVAKSYPDFFADLKRLGARVT